MANHTEKEYYDASSIAYLTFLEESKEQLGERDEPYTIKELIENYIDLDYAKETRALLNPDTIFGYEDEITEFKSLIHYSELPIETKELISNLSDEAFSWTFLENVDKNASTGFYACLLGTSEKDAMVAFRGSEGYSDANGNWNYLNSVNDWLEADLKLIGGETPQDEDAKRFADQVVLPFLKDHIEYQEIDVTGHSLGGELATTFTLHCAEENEELYEKIGKCVNLDGPGKDIDFIEAHKEGIARMQEKTYLHRASLVGEMLYPLASEENISYVQIIDEYETGEFARHSLKNWKIDEEGNIVEGNRSEFAKIVGDLSRRVDNTGLETGAISAINWLEEDIIEENEYNELVISERGHEIIDQALIDLAVVCGATLAIGGIATLALPLICIGIYVGVTFVLFLGAYLYCEREKIKRDLVKFAKKVNLEIGTKLKNIVSDARDTIDRIGSQLNSYWNDISSFAEELLSVEKMLVKEQPYFKVDTEILKELANRLNNVRKKIQTVDKKIDSIYFNVKWYDLADLMLTDIGIGDDHYLKNCSNALQKVAEDFEKAEKKIIESFQ